MDHKYNNWHLYKERMHIDVEIQERQHHVKMGSKVGLLHLQAKDCQQPLETKREVSLKPLEIINLYFRFLASRNVRK